MFGFGTTRRPNETNVQQRERELIASQETLKNRPGPNLRRDIFPLATLGASVILVSSFAFSIPAAIGLGTVYTVALSFPTRWLARKRRRDIIDTINTQQQELVKAKIEEIDECKKNESINFIFNTYLNLAPTDLREIPSVTLNDELMNSLMAAFNKPHLDENLTLPLIDITDAEMSDNHLKSLLVAGMGKYNTTRLVLKNNLLSDLSVGYLKSAVVDKKSSFKNLRVLDLSNNDLTGDCLSDLARVVQYLDIEELDLSDNEMLCNGSSENVVSFIRKLKNEMPSIKKLHLRNVGLSPEHLAELGKVLDSVSLLEYLDIRENSDLEVCSMVEGVKRNLRHNLSLKVLKTDFDTTLLKMVGRLKDHNDAFSLIESSEINNSSIVIEIINKYLIGKNQIPKALSDLLLDKNSKLPLLQDIVKKVKTLRHTILGVDQNLAIPITQAEYIACMKGQLTGLYMSLQTGDNHNDKVHADLISHKIQRDLSQITQVETPIYPASNDEDEMSQDPVVPLQFGSQQQRTAGQPFVPHLMPSLGVGLNPRSRFTR